MAYFVDPTGRLVEADPSTPEELMQLQRRGFQPATDSDIQRHNHAQDVAEADQGGFSTQALGEAAARGVGAAAGLIGDVAGITGTRPGLADADLTTGERAAETLYEGSTSPEARLRAEAHPFSAGVGTGLAAAPAAIPAGLAAGGAAAALGAGALATTGAAILGEQAVEAVAQEYDDAWLEQRPMELKNVATYTAMFSLGDGLFRGLGAGIGKLFGAGEKKAAGGLGARNIVAESNAQLRKEAGPLKGRPRSVGAAASADIDEPFDAALKTMSERDAAVLDRDADDYLSLIGMHAADGMNRLRRGLDEDLSNLVKYQDFEKGAEGWTRANLEAQAAQLTELGELGAETAAKLRARPTDELSLDYGNMGRAVAKTIDDFSRRINAPGTNPARLNYLTDEFKKRLDSHMMKIDASFSVDAVTRKELKDQIRPLVEQAREGLMDVGAWGNNAKLQRELNPGWHQLLKHWGGLQQKLYERTGEVLYDHAGAGRVVMEATTRRMMDLLQQDPRLRKELGQHLSGAFDGLTDLINARRRNGIVQTDNLDRLLEDIAGLKEDWNLASTIGVARNMTAHAKKDPRRWAEIAKELAARAPVVGGGIGAADRALGRIMQGTRLEKGTALADVWDRGLSRYAKHPDLADPSISRNYSEWLREQLKEHGGKVAAVGLLGAGAAAQDDTEGASLAGAGVLALLGKRFGRRALFNRTEARAALSQKAARAVDVAPTIGGEVASKALGRELPPIPAEDVFTHAANVSPGGVWGERLSGPIGKTPGGFFRGDDGVIRYVKADKDPVHSAIEIGNASMYNALGVRAPDMRAVDLPGGQKAVASEYLGDAWKELEELPDWSELAPSVKEGYARMVPVDVIMGNWDVSRNARNVLTDGKSVVMIDPGEAGVNAWGAKWFAGNEAQTAKELRRTVQAVGGSGPLTDEDTLLHPDWGPWVGKAPPHRLLAPSEFSEGRVRELMEQSFSDAVSRIEKAGGAESFIAKHQPTLSPEEVSRAASEMNHRIVELRKALPTLAAVVAVAFGASRADAAEPPPENARPEVTYRQALQENARGGAALAQQLGIQMFRGAKGKPGGSAIDDFARGGGLEKATERVRGLLQELGDDPGALIDRVAGSLGELPRTHPGVYSEMVGKAVQIVGYLEGVMPRRRGSSIANPEGFSPSYDEMIEFAQRYAGATTPVVVARRLARGEASPLELEALRENWPEWIAQLQAGALGAVARAAEEGTSMSPELLGRLDRDLGMNGALDPMQSAGMADYLLRVFAAEDQREAEQKQGAGQSGGGGAQSTRYQTRLGSIRTQRAMN